MTSYDRAGKLGELYERIRSDPQYRSENMGTTFVPGVGTLDEGSIVFVGEAPGREEERAGRPFVGPAGRNLDTLLAEAGLPRDRVYITNLVKYRPFDVRGENRSPTAAESRRALPYLLDELKILAPRVVVCLGLSAAKALLQDLGLRMAAANGVVFEKEGLKVLVTYHPSPYNYLIPDKRTALHGAFRRLRELYDSEG